MRCLHASDPSAPDYNLRLTTRRRHRRRRPEVRKPMKYVRGLVCRECGHDFPVAPQHVCEFCFGPLEVAYDYEAIAADTSREQIEAGPASMWRYGAFLPAPEDARVDIGAGWSRLRRAPRLAAEL